MTISEVKSLTQNYNPSKRWEILHCLINDGLLESREYSTKEIADMLNMTPAGIRKIEKSAMKKLKPLLEKILY
jgi:DNA-directed RNA polymerase specialized sigma subunit